MQCVSDAFDGGRWGNVVVIGVEIRISLKVHSRKT